MKQIEKELDILFPVPDCELKFDSNFELLVSVILSAQCTDKRVNSVTKTLFKKYKTPLDFANLQQQVLEKEIYSLGFFRNKAKNIISASKQIVEKFNGEVPSTFEELTSLSGVGRKTANVVLSVAFSVPAIAVDTHVFRTSTRLGINNSHSVTDCEKSLENYFSKETWGKRHLQLVLFGRNICKSQNPKCDECPFKNICIYKGK